MKMLRLVLAAVLALGVGLTATVTATTASALAGQLGAPQVVLNPGGGDALDGSDGLRFVVNAAGDGTNATYWAGQDQAIYRGTPQYCCSAGAPMLNIGGTLYGQAGPAGESSVNWSSLTVLSTTGSAVAGSVPVDAGSAGDAGAVLRYEAVKNGLTYTVVRTIGYVYPNSSITDSYEFTIPQGNTEQVKFYLGGDTAPGGSDQGVGVMFTEPVRSVYSVNPYTQIQFGFQEIAGSKPFDGATARSFYTPNYPLVQAGGDIGFAAVASVHDAELVMQWNLGSTPGTQTAALRASASTQGVNLSASFAPAVAALGTSSVLDIAVENTRPTSADQLGYTFTLPTGVIVDPAGTPTNGCAGTLTANGSAVTLSGGQVAAATNCTVSVPVTAAATGEYVIGSSSVSATNVVENQVGTSTLTVGTAPVAPTEASFEAPVGSPASFSLTAEGWPIPTYAVTSGSLPVGLVLDPSTGEIAGTPTSVGSSSVTVTATNVVGATSFPVAVTVTHATPTIGLTVAPDLTSYGTAATLEVSLPGSATGTVTFLDEVTTLCTVSTAPWSCDAPSTMAVGTHTVTASYSGDGYWAPAVSASVTLIVQKAPVVLAATLTPSQVTFGEQAAIAASLTVPGATGTVNVTSGATTLCSITLPATTCSTPSDLAAGSYPVVANYLGDDNFNAASAGAGTLVVAPGTPGGIPSATYAGTYGEDITLDFDQLTGPTQGTVSFGVDDGPVLCTYDVAAATECVAAAFALDAGTYELAITVSGDPNYEDMTYPATLDIAKMTTALSVPVAIDGTYGDAIQIPTTGLPGGATGTVTVRHGADVLCTADVNAAACVLPAGAAAGSYNVAVEYSGDTNHAGSVANSTITIARATTAVATADTLDVARGTAALIVVTGIPADATGSVAVTDAAGSTVCTFDVTDSDRCAASSSSAGELTLTVTYPGDINYSGSNTSTVLTVAKDVITLTVPDALAIDEDEELTVEVGGLPEDATGLVTVSWDVPGGANDVLCSFDVATSDSCTVPAAGGLTPGSYDLTMAYGGDVNYEATSSSLSLEVSAAAVTPTPAEPEPTDPEPTDPEDANGPEELAQTGATFTRLGAVGLTLLIGGAGLVVMDRRRKTFRMLK